MRYERSSKLFADAEKVLPGGVNSPVRAFKGVGGTPLFIKSAKGAYLYDEDGNRYIDYINSWGPTILGHAFDPVVEAISAKAKQGTSFGAPTELETQIAQLAIKMVPNIDKIRFVNSGTEACMSAVRLARGFTGRDKIIKFAGCYHGHADSFLIQAGSGASTFGTPNSPGVTQGTAADTLLANYNDANHVRQLIHSNPDQIAAVIIEPIAGNMGCVPPISGFLEEVRSLCNQYGIVLIFDEVMTGFRLAAGGCQELFNIKADIVAFGKVIGGGLPVGAFAAREEIMKYLAPIGPVYQAGTLSGNPLAMAAGYAMLQALDNDRNVYVRIEEKTKYLHAGLLRVLQKAGLDFTINQIGSMISVHFEKKPVIDFDTATLAANSKFPQFFHGLLNKGIYIAPSAYETWFVSDALSYGDLDETINAAEQVAKTIL